jgi:hypothetical protein
MEGLWMLAGRCDVAWISQFNTRMKEYSDDGKEFHGAYGRRWRDWFDMLGGAEEEFPDQLPKIVRMLKSNIDERRAVLTMWDPVEDLERPELKDVPCNLLAMFKIRQGRLTMTVCCRSNDVIWGVYGANACHFSMLQEYMAAQIDVPVGSYFQISDSWHAYTERWEQFGGHSKIPSRDYYSEGIVEPYPMVDVPASWDDELRRWMEGTEDFANRTRRATEPYQNSFFPLVASPMFDAYYCYKLGDFAAAYSILEHRCAATDWKLAGRLWLEAIEQKRREKGKA